MPDTIRCIIADDEPLAVRLLADYVRKTPGCEVVFQSTRILDVIQYLEQYPADLLLLDIQMPDLTGMQLLKTVPLSCWVILTTAYPEYALEGYQYDVLDYLLKPITYDRFLTAIQKLKKAHGSTLPVKKEPESIFIKTEHRMLQVNFDSLFYIEARRDYLAFHTCDGISLTLESLRHMEELLPPERFLRIHKSYIINTSKIQFIERNRVVVNNQYLPIGEAFKERLSNYIKH